MQENATAFNYFKKYLKNTKTNCNRGPHLPFSRRGSGGRPNLFRTSCF